MIVVGAGTAAGKIGALVKEMQVASTFGAGDAVDAYLIAFLLPAYAINVLAGSLNSALVPTYVQVQQRDGPDAAQRLLSTVMAWAIGILAVVATALAATGWVLLPRLGSGFSEEKLRVTQHLFFVLLPAIILTGVSTTWGAVLNASGNFSLPAFATVLTPLATLGSVILFAGAWGPFAIAAGTVGGAGLEVVALGFALRRRGISGLPRWHANTASVRSVLAQYRPMVAGSLVMSGNPVIDQSMAASLGAGSVAALGYGSKAVAFVMGIGAVSLSQAVLPHFARMTAAGEWAAIRRLIRVWTVALLAITIPAALLVAWLSPEIVRILYQRGSFSPSDAALVASVQALLVLQLPFHLTGMLFVRLISALGSNRALMWIGVVNAIVNVIGNLALMPILGTRGIALSTTLMYGLSFFMAGAFIVRRLGRLTMPGAPT